MASFVSYTPTSLIAKAMFNFDEMDMTSFKLTGTIRVSVSDGFSDIDVLDYALYDKLSYDIDPEVTWTADQIEGIKQILTTFSRFAKLKFQFVGDIDTLNGSSVASPLQVGSDALSDINITFFNPGDTSYLGVSGVSDDNEFGYAGGAGDIFINPFGFTHDVDTSFAEYSAIRQTFMHEMLHSLGVSHPHVDSETDVSVDYQALMGAGFQKLGFKLSSPEDMNKEYFTIMAYDNQSSAFGDNANTPMILDVIALSVVYGEGAGTTGMGNDTIEAGSWGYRTYFDTGGIDTVDLYLHDKGAKINLGIAISSAPHLVGIVTSVSDAKTMATGGSPSSLRWLYGEYENVLGSAAGDNIIGNKLSNKLRGLGGNDKLDGADGKDRLTGDAGADRFVFDTKLGSSNLDHITDFAHKVDKILLDNAIFTKLGSAGALKKACFLASSTGTPGKSGGADDYILYNTKTGALCYDADGSGKAAAPVQFALLDNKSALTYDDFLVI